MHYVLCIKYCRFRATQENLVLVNNILVSQKTSFVGPVEIKNIVTYKAVVALNPAVNYVYNKLLIEEYSSFNKKVFCVRLTKHLGLNILC